MPYWIYLAYYLVLDYQFTPTSTYVGILLNPICVILNAAINPVVYYLRISGMKKQVAGTLKNINFPRSPGVARRRRAEGAAARASLSSCSTATTRKNLTTGCSTTMGMGELVEQE